MLKIRLQRFGKKKQPTFRVVLTESKNSAKSGKILETFGFYNPETKERSLKADRIKFWLTHGVQLSGTINNFLIREGIMKGKKVHVASRPKLSKKGEVGPPSLEKKNEAKETETKSEEKTVVPEVAEAKIEAA